MAYGIAQQQLWAELLCCPKCGNVYSLEHLPVNLICGRHLLCSVCCSQENSYCPFDKSDAKWDGSAKLYVNGPVLSIVLNNDDLCKQHLDRSMKTLCPSDSPQLNTIERLEHLLHEFAKFLYRVSSEKCATVSSNRLSRTIQRKLFALFCINFWSEESRAQIPKLLCSMNERIVSELILCIQSSSANLSSSLWSAVRSRGCQFLGPALQDDVLKLILLMLHKGESIARKTLVLYVVKELGSIRSEVSKTSVGHVVQLLYRASCFNVIKQEGKSSLMQLKEEFRTYKSLRFEHDSQIVQIAMDFGLRISPEQWSSLLYGDCYQRKYMQSVCERLSANSQNAVDELRKLIDKKLSEKELGESNTFDKKQLECDLLGIQTALDHFDALMTEQFNSSGDEIWFEIEQLLIHLHEVLKIYTESIERRNIAREHQQKRPIVQKGYGMLRGGRCEISHFTNGTPLRSLHPPSIPIDFGCRSNVMPVSSLIYTPQPPPTFIEQQQFPIGTPPGFLAQIPLNVSQTRFPSSNMGRNCTNVGSPPDLLSRSIFQQKHLQMDAFDLETMSGQLIPLLPTHQFVPTAFVEPFNTVTTSVNTFMSSATSPSTNNSLNGSALMAPIQSTNSPFSTSPPSYQFTSNNTQLMATPAAFPIPVQTQPVFLYGSTPPFGSPPLLIPQFANWTTPMDSGGFMSGAGFYNINAFNTANTTASSDSKSPQKQAETSFESEEEHKGYKKCRHSSRTTADEDDSECHVSFTVATSVLHGHDELEHSFGSLGWNLELPPLPVGQLNIPIPLSPSNVTYTVACDSAKPNLCTIIRPSTTANAPTPLFSHPISTVPIVQDLGTEAKLKDVGLVTN